MTNIPVPISSEVKAAAAAWLARLRADDRSVADEHAFQEWLTTAPAHAIAFETVSSVWDIAGGLSHGLRGLEARPPAIRRRQVLAGLGTVLASGGTFSVWHAAHARVYQTDVGEQKHLMLEDGSHVFLDTDTRIEVKFDDATRAAELSYGRANFRITPDPNRLFIVSAADKKIVAAASDFDVQREDGQVSFLLIKGPASLQAAVPGGPERIMRSGERLIAEKSEIDRVDKPNLAPLTAWKTGRLIFDNDKLSEAVHEMNRYSVDKLEIEDIAIVDIRVSGIYYVGDNVAFANSVSRLLPVKMRRDGKHVYLSADPARLIQG